MEAQAALEKLKKSTAFKEWFAVNKKQTLSHAFAMCDSEQAASDIAEWQIGYYNSEKDRMTTFFVGKAITKSQEAEVFKEAWFEYKKAMDLDPFYQPAKTAHLLLGARMMTMPQQRVQFAT